MSQTTTGALRDDITGGRAAETVSFALDNTAYEITLNKRNATALRKLIGGYIDAGRPAGTVVEIDSSAVNGQPSATRKTTTRRKRAAKKNTARSSKAKSGATTSAKQRSTAKSGRRSSRAASAPSQADIRTWAIEQGLQVSARGRVSNDVRDQYLAAH